METLKRRVAILLHFMGMGVLADSDFAMPVNRDFHMRSQWKPGRRQLGCGPDGNPLVGLIDADCRFHLTFTAQEEDIDEMGHVNNAVWVVWLQDASVAHWYWAARPEHRNSYAAIVLQHEINYRGNVALGAEVRASTWIQGPPRGARYDRRVDFHDQEGRLLVTATTQWGLIARETGRLTRATPEIAAPFFPQ